MNIKPNYTKLGFFLLLVINLAAFSAFILNKITPTEPAAVGGMGQLSHYLGENLGYTGSQMELYLQLKADFDQESTEIMQRMHQQRNLMFELISDNNIDTVALNQASEKFGFYQGQLKKATMHHFIRLKSISNEDQKDKLNQLFESMQSRQHRGQGKGLGRHRLNNN
jgi:Spy/CpxP family protein refolding chaperone